jgi:hypothetical protein
LVKEKLLFLQIAASSIHFPTRITLCFERVFDKRCRNLEALKMTVVPPPPNPPNPKHARDAVNENFMEKIKKCYLKTILFGVFKLFKINL